MCHNIGSTMPTCLAFNKIGKAVEPHLSDAPRFDLAEAPASSLKRSAFDRGSWEDDDVVTPPTPKRRRSLSLNPDLSLTVCKLLEGELLETQARVVRNPDFDVHRGKGQGIKNMNARFYTPSIASRAIEYSKINESSGKRAVALEILIELARRGGRILDSDNAVQMENDKAVKKVMSALKDKARELKKNFDPVPREKGMVRKPYVFPDFFNVPEQASCLDYWGRVEKFDLELSEDEEELFKLLEE